MEALLQFQKTERKKSSHYRLTIVFLNREEKKVLAHLPLTEIQEKNKNLFLLLYNN